MKRMLAAFLALLAVSGLLMVSAGAVKTTTKPYTLDAKYVESYAGSAKVEVTVNGYIGSLDKKACGIGSGLGADDSEEIIVLKSGSDVKFTIKASNPNAYYNYCYTKGVKALEEKAAAEGNTYPAIYDDCGGGVMLTREGDNFGSLSMFVWPNDDGTAKMNAAGFNVASGRKISNNTYAYTAHDGLYSFAFQSKDKNGDPVMDSYGYEARYELGTFLFVTDEQIAQLEKEGTMTFHENLNNEFIVYDYVYPGLAELLGVEVSEQAPEESAKEEPDALFEESSVKEYDEGLQYTYTIKNTTKEPMKGCYVLAFYDLYKDYDYQYPALQMHKIDVDLKPGEVKREKLTSHLWGLSNYEMAWIKFEDNAERTKFLSDDRLDYDRTSGIYSLDYGREEKISVAEADSWFEEYLDVTLTVK